MSSFCTPGFLESEIIEQEMVNVRNRHGAWHARQVNHLRPKRR